VLKKQKDTGKHFSLYQIVSMAIDIATGISYLHSKNIIHRDIKPANFLVTESFVVKVIDFGVSRVMSQDIKMTMIGTPVYMAPEVMNDEVYTEKADIYGFALVLYELITLEAAYSDVDRFDICTYVATEKKRPTIPKDCNVALAALTTRCWNDRPGDRPSLASILDTLFEIRLESGETFGEYNQRLSEAILQPVCDYVDLSDLYSMAQACRGWYLLVDNIIGEIGLQPANRHLAKQRSEWKQVLIKRHSENKLRRNALSEVANHRTSAGKIYVSNPNTPLAHKIGGSSPIGHSTSMYVASPKVVLNPVIPPTPLVRGSSTKRQTRNYEKELVELRKMLDGQKKLNQDLQHFKKKYEEHAKKRNELKISKSDYIFQEDLNCEEEGGDTDNSDSDGVVIVD